MTSYSAFFSSGLLAPRSSPNILPKIPSTDQNLNGCPTPSGDSSPIRPVSPLPSTDSDVDLETLKSDNDVDMDRDHAFARESTPTQHSVSAALATGNLNQVASSKPTSGATNGLQPRLRRRRSSLSMSTSPMDSIRSPTRNVGAALQLQRHLISPGSRSRSGSTTAPPSAVDGGFPSFGVASEGTSLVGRIRSGSVGSNARQVQRHAPPPTNATVRANRRHVRRITSVPAPAPPPSSPLPALPPVPMSDKAAASRTPFSFQNHGMPRSEGVPTPSNGPFKGRDRGLSVASSVGRIDEELKEN